MHTQKLKQTNWHCQYYCFTWVNLVKTYIMMGNVFKIRVCFCFNLLKHLSQLRITISQQLFVSTKCVSCRSPAATVDNRTARGDDRSVYHSIYWKWPSYCGIYLLKFSVTFDIRFANKHFISQQIFHTLYVDNFIKGHRIWALKASSSYKKYSLDKR